MRAKLQTMSALEDMELEGLIRKRREEGCTYAEISEELCRTFPGKRGFSSRSIRRVCEDRGIHRSSRLSHNELRKVVATAVSQVREQNSYIVHFVVLLVFLYTLRVNFDLPRERGSSSLFTFLLEASNRKECR